MANPYFNAQYYLTQNPDLLAAGINTVEAAWAHYVNYGAAEALNGVSSRSPAPWFDVKYYLSVNPDLVTSGLTGAQLFEHFVTYGINEGRVPSAAAAQMTDASLLAYAKGNADLATAFGVAADATSLTDAQRDGLANHFYEYGYKEGRADSPFTPDNNPGETFTLTAGADNFTGTAGNDTFTAADVAAAGGGATATWSAGDKLDGGAGNDTFTIISNSAITNPVGITVANIETINATSGATGTNLNTTAFTGLEAVNVTAVGNVTATSAGTTAVSVTNGTLANGQSVTINGGSTVNATTTAAVTAGAGAGTVNVGGATAAAGAVTVKTTSTLETAIDTVANTGTGTVVNVTGGTSVTVDNTLATTGAAEAGDVLTGGLVTVIGNANTTTVSVTQTAARTQTATSAGIANGGVTITDGNVATAADTITNVSLANFGNSTITSTALNTLSLTGGATATPSGAVILNQSAADTSTAATTLALNLNGGSVGAISGTQAAAYTTLNVAGAKAASTVANFTSAGVTAVNVSGDQAVTFTSIAGLNNLATVTSTNAAGLTLGSALLATTAFTGGAGNDTITLGASHARNVDMGAGNDTVVYGGTLLNNTLRVNAGEGTDTIAMTSTQAVAASASGVFNTTFNGFDVLRVTMDADGDVVSLAGINGVNSVVARDGGATQSITINGFKQNGTLTLDTAANAATSNFNVNIVDANVNPNDVINVVLSNDAGARDFGTVTAANIETVNLSTVDVGTAANTAATRDTLKLAASSATTIKVSGNNGLILDNTGNTAVTLFDASGVVANSTNDTAANLGVTFVSANATALANVTIIGGAGDDFLTGSIANDSFVLTSGGSDTVTLQGTRATNGLDNVTSFTAGDSNGATAGLGNGDVLNLNGATAVTLQDANGAGAGLIFVAGNGTADLTLTGASVNAYLVSNGKGNLLASDIVTTATQNPTINGEIVLSDGASAYVLQTSAADANVFNVYRAFDSDATAGITVNVELIGVVNLTNTVNDMIVGNIA